MMMMTMTMMMMSVCVFSSHRVLNLGGHIKNQKLSYNHPGITLRMAWSWRQASVLALIDIYLRPIEIWVWSTIWDQFKNFLSYWLSYQDSRNTVKNLWNCRIYTGPKASMLDFNVSDDCLDSNISYSEIRHFPPWKSDIPHECTNLEPTSSLRNMRN